jgi:hypothetical protein
MTLFVSRGYESVTSKLFMRGTVIAADVLIFLPAVYAFVNTYYAALPWSKRVRWRPRSALLECSLSFSLPLAQLQPLVLNLCVGLGRR